MPISPVIAVIFFTFFDSLDRPGFPQQHTGQHCVISDENTLYRREGSNESGSLSSTLLGRLRQKDPEAWARLTNVFGPLVYHWCRRAGLNSEDAADVFQDTFRSVAAGLSRFRRDRTGDSFRGWLATITRNKIRDLYRRNAQSPEPAGGTEFQLSLQEFPDPFAAEDEQSVDHENHRLLHRALELIRVEFEHRTWEAFWRATVDQQSPQDIARDLGISVNAVYKAKSRVLRRLREELDGLVGS